MISIRTRLALIFTLAIFFIFSVAAILLYWQTHNLLYKADYEFLADEADTMQYIAENAAIDLTALKEAVMTAPQTLEGSLYRYYIRVFDEKKKLLMQTPGAETFFTKDKQAINTNLSAHKRRYFWMEKNDIHYLLLLAPIKFGRSHQYGAVEIALDVSYQHDIFQSRKKLIGILLCGTIIALVIGLLIAHRGVRSLYLLTEAVQKITATSLHKRIDPKAWPRELSGLVIAFNQMLERIEASFLRLKQFSSDLSHEMRTPITNMIGQTEISLSYAHSVEEYRNVLESNLEELHRIASLIENILFLARAENPQLDLSKAPLQVRDEIELVADYFSAIADEKNIKIINEGDAKVVANQVMFRRLLSNILSNAVKFSRSGGTIRFQTSEDAGVVQIILQDDGIGIANEHIPKIFDRFYRVETDRKQSPGGTGLGLAIVKSIVEMHHGSLTVLSQYGKGTIITIRLPTIS